MFLEKSQCLGPKLETWPENYHFRQKYLFEVAYELLKGNFLASLAAEMPMARTQWVRWSDPSVTTHTHTHMYLLLPDLATSSNLISSLNLQETLFCKFCQAETSAGIGWKQPQRTTSLSSSSFLWWIPTLRGASASKCTLVRPDSSERKKRRGSNSPRGLTDSDQIAREVEKKIFGLARLWRPSFQAISGQKSVICFLYITNLLHFVYIYIFIFDLRYTGGGARSCAQGFSWKLSLTLKYTFDATGVVQATEAKPQVISQPQVFLQCFISTASLHERIFTIDAECTP